MPNMNWSQISHLQLGKIAEYMAQTEFLSYGYECYDTVVDDRGIDFLVRKNGNVFEVQVKAVRNGNYTFIAKSKMPNPLTDGRLVCYMNFTDGSMPEVYVIPSTAWSVPNAVLVYKANELAESKPEYGINYSKKNEDLLAPYKAESILGNHASAE